MKKFLFVLVTASLLLAACGGAKPPAAVTGPLATYALRSYLSLPLIRRTSGLING